MHSLKQRGEGHSHFGGSNTRLGCSDLLRSPVLLFPHQGCSAGAVDHQIPSAEPSSPRCAPSPRPHKRPVSTLGSVG